MNKQTFENIIRDNEVHMTGTYKGKKVSVIFQVRKDGQVYIYKNKFICFSGGIKETLHWFNTWVKDGFEYKLVARTRFTEAIIK